MVLNDFRADIKEMVSERGQYQSDAAYAMGLSRQVFDSRCYSKIFIRPKYE